MPEALESENRLEVRRLKNVFATVYFVQGMKSLPDLSIFFYLMNVIRATPFVGQIFQGLSSIAWFIKPVWGWISDRFILLGYRRKSYFIVMAFLAMTSWLFLGVSAFLGWKSVVLFLVLINISNLAYAFVDVVTDAVMVEEGQRLNKVGSFVNFQWFLHPSFAGLQVVCSQVTSMHVVWLCGLSQVLFAVTDETNPTAP